MTKNNISGQTIGLLPLISLVTGNLVGSGVFMLPSTLAAYGAISIFGWLVTALGAIFLALIFANFAAKEYIQTGGPYVYIKQAFGYHAGLYTGFGYWSMSWLSNSALAIGAVGYLSVICGEFSKYTAFALEIAILITITGFNLLGIRTTGRGELVITTLKVIPLLLLPLFGLWHIDVNNFTPLNHSGETDFTAINSVAFITLWAFIGIETAGVPSKQVANPRRTIPIATIVGTLIAAVIYLLGTIVIMGVVPHERLVNSVAPYAEAASMIFSGSWAIPVALAAIFSCIGTLNGWTMVVGRIPKALADDNMAPKIFAKTNQYDTPYVGIILSATLTFIFMIFSLQDDLVQQFNFVIDVAVTLVLVIYFLAVLAYAKLSIVNRELNGINCILILGGIAFILWALWASGIKMILLSMLFMLSGVPFHLAIKRNVYL